jgi:hypothetical protein
VDEPEVHVPSGYGQPAVARLHLPWSERVVVCMPHQDLCVDQDRTPFALALDPGRRMDGRLLPLTHR